MSPTRKATTVAERYDLSFTYARGKALPPDASRPALTSAWPPGHLDVLTHYREWLLSGGPSPYTTDHLYLPMAGHVLGLNLKPVAEFDLDRDLARALDYIQAKRLSAEWTDICRNALNKFRLFLHQQRGAISVPVVAVSTDRYRQGLPDWLVTELERYAGVLQVRWRGDRVRDQWRRFWYAHGRLWRWLVEHHAVTELAQVKRRYILDYVDHMVGQGYAVTTINNHLLTFHAFLLFLEENDYPVPRALLRPVTLKAPDRLPKYLTDDQVHALQKDLGAGSCQPCGA